MSRTVFARTTFILSIICFLPQVGAAQEPGARAQVPAASTEPATPSKPIEAPAAMESRPKSNEIVTPWTGTKPDQEILLRTVSDSSLSTFRQEGLSLRLVHGEYQLSKPISYEELAGLHHQMWGTRVNVEYQVGFVDKTPLVVVIDVPSAPAVGSTDIYRIVDQHAKTLGKDLLSAGVTAQECPGEKICIQSCAANPTECCKWNCR